MAQYDGSIRIKTEITTKQAEVQLSTLQNRIVKTADTIESLRSKMDALKDSKVPTQEYKNLQKELDVAAKELEKMVAQDSKLTDIDEKIKKLSKSSAEYAAKMKEVSEKKIPTESYASVEKQIVKTENALNNLQKKQEKFIADGGKESSDKYKKMASDAEVLDQKLQVLLKSQEKLESKGLAFKSGADTEQYKNLSAKYEQVNAELEKQKGIHSEIAQKQAETVQKTIELKSQINQLVAEGKAFTLGSDTEEYAKLGQQLQYAENEMDVLTQKEEIQNLKIEQAKEGYKKLGDTAKKSIEKISKSQKKATGLLGSFGTRLKSILSAVFIFNLIRKALNSMISGIKDGFQNLYNDNEKFKSSVDSLKASLTTFKNTLAAAFAPIVEIAIPYIEKMINYMAHLMDMVGQFIAAITGQKTYTKAIKQTADAFEDAKEAADGYLSPLDEINKYQTSKKDEEDQTGLMFEEVPIDSKILDFLQKIKDFLQPIIDYAKKLKDIFMQGFWDGLGDWEYRWQSIKDSIASIKESLIDIFTDPAVLAAADAWAQSVAYMLGSLVGSLASIGLTITTNLLGGIAKYLEQNKDRIKNYLIDMFNIWEEVNYLFADLFQSIAYVFEAFASDEGQQLTANIIGIFVDAFMGVTELASKIFRDIASIIIKPFVDNKEGFRTALEGFLGVLAEVTGTIKQGIDDTFDKLNEVYDEHFKPFFDSVAQGLSDLVGQFLEFWNGSVQPILDQWASDFDELWKTHIQPLLNNVAEFLGKIADLLKVLWENILQPFIEYVIQNVLPKLLPVIQAVWDTLKNLFGYISDMVSEVITILGGLIDFITGVFSGDWEKAFQGLSDMVGGFVEFIRLSIEGGLQLISDLLSTFIEITKSSIDLFLSAIQKTVEIFVNYIKEKIIGKFNEIKEGFLNFKSNITETWTNTWNALYEKLLSIIDKIKNTVKSAVDWISEKISSITSSFSTLTNKASGLFSSSSGENSTYSAARTIAYSSPTVAALSNFDIPGYATGQVIPRTMKQHLAVLGDNSEETEVVSPLSTMKQALKEAMTEMGGIGGSGNIKVQVLLDKKVVGETMVSYGKIQQMSTGSNPFLLGTT